MELLAHWPLNPDLHNTYVRRLPHDDDHCPSSKLHLVREHLFPLHQLQRDPANILGVDSFPCVDLLDLLLRCSTSSLVFFNREVLLLQRERRQRRHFCSYGKPSVGVASSPEGVDDDGQRGARRDVEFGSDFDSVDWSRSSDQCCASGYLHRCGGKTARHGRWDEGCICCIGGCGFGGGFGVVEYMMCVKGKWEESWEGREAEAVLNIA